MKMIKINSISKMLFLLGILCWVSCQEKTSSADLIVTNENGSYSMTLFGNQTDLESLRTALQDSLMRMDSIPDNIEIEYNGEVLMGMRGEVETEVNEAIAAAKSAKLAPVVDILSFRKEKGIDCDQPDSLRTNCANIDLEYPIVESGPQILKDSVNRWVNNFLIGMLEGWKEEGETHATTLEEGAKAFFDRHEEFKGSAVYGGFEARCGADVLLSNGQYLSLAIDGYTYQGGAHGSPMAAFGTFETQTGKQLTWDDIVTDKSAFQALAEKKFREERAEIFQDGFEFDEIFQFQLPDNFALIDSGVYLHYQPYEVGPYAIGSSTFVIRFNEMGELSKINQ